MRCTTTFTSIGNLATAAAATGRASASGGRWWAEADEARERVTVGHYRTAMLTIDMRTGEAFPSSSGWGSMTDKVGVGKVLVGASVVNARRYADLFG